jgi:hypothetical protein
MMSAMTRQDLVTATEQAKNTIIERLVTKYDVQSAADSARDKILGTLQALHLENQTLMRQSNAQRDQVWRKTAALETQIASLQQDIRVLYQMVSRMFGVVLREVVDFVDNADEGHGALLLVGYLHGSFISRFYEGAVI